VTFLAWDSSGRPTTGTISTGATLSYVYNDAARTSTGTSNPGNSVTTLTFDTNGNMIPQDNPGAASCYVAYYTVMFQKDRVRATIADWLEAKAQLK
jgi:YD repeat-containing protein